MSDYEVDVDTLIGDAIEQDTQAAFHYATQRGSRGEAADKEELTFYEFVDVPAARKILHNWNQLWADGKLGIGVWKFGHDALPDELDETDAARDAARETFAQWLAGVETETRKHKGVTIRAGTRKVTYTQTKRSHRYGRYYSVKSMGMSAFARAIRHTVADKYYIDIDIRNCHPTIMLWLADQHGLTTQGPLRDYTISKENREAMLERIRGLLGSCRRATGDPDATRDDAKQHTLSWAYGRNLQDWLDGSNKKKRAEAKALLADPVVRALYDSMRNTNAAIAELYPEKVDLVKESNRSKGNAEDQNLACKVASRVVLDVENDVLFYLVDFLSIKKESKLKAEDRVPGNEVLMFDGFQVPRERVDLWESKGHSVEAALAAAERFVAKKIPGLAINLEVKPMDCVIDLSAYPDPHALEDVAADVKRQRQEAAEGRVHTVGPIQYVDVDGLWFTRLLQLLVDTPFK